MNIYFSLQGRGLPLRFSQENIRDFRVRIACDILRLRID